MNDENQLLIDEERQRTRNPVKLLLPEDLKKYWRTFLLASILLIAGIIFLVMAIYIVFLPDAIQGPHSYVFFLCSAICIIPGGYHVVYMCCALRRNNGYKLENIPTFSEY